MALLHSLVDGLRIQNKCHQKEGVTLKSLLSYRSHAHGLHMRHVLFLTTLLQCLRKPIHWERA
jgi:hypothetical protein